MKTDFCHINFSPAFPRTLVAIALAGMTVYPATGSAQNATDRAALVALYEDRRFAVGKQYELEYRHAPRHVARRHD